jgi:adenosylhomocysteine nucleosidase
MPAGARRAAEELIRSGADAIVSFGLAGGLDPALAPGALVVPAALMLPTGETVAADPALLARFGKPTHRLMLAAEAPVARIADKAAFFRQTGAVAVDLESGAVAEVAQSHGLAWAVVRVVCDPAGRDLPPAALAALDPQSGGIAGLRVLVSLLRRPTQIPALIRLARDTAAAQRSLTRVQLSH